jgi:regulator of cell morphogenesis and NO signaling
MADQPISAALEEEHRQFDEELATFRAGLVDGKWLTLPGAQTLRRHIYLEEEFLFPELRRSGLEAPVMVMVREHGEIWSVLDTIEDAAAAAMDTTLAREACDRLSDLLAEHNLKEERILYPAADRLISPESAASLRTAVKSASLPPEWQCEALRA